MADGVDRLQQGFDDIKESIKEIKEELKDIRNSISAIKSDIVMLNTKIVIREEDNRKFEEKLKDETNRKLTIWGLIISTVVIIVDIFAILVGRWI